MSLTLSRQRQYVKGERLLALSSTVKSSSPDVKTDTPSTAHCEGGNGSIAVPRDPGVIAVERLWQN
jgi:hypothetical protein